MPKVLFCIAMLLMGAVNITKDNSFLVFVGGVELFVSGMYFSLFLTRND